MKVRFELVGKITKAGLKKWTTIVHQKFRGVPRTRVVGCDTVCR